MKFDNFVQTVLELKINLKNSFPWYVLSKKQCEELNLSFENFKKLFYFSAENYTYVVVYTFDEEIHFWNHTAVVANSENDSILTKTLNIFDQKNTLKIVATIFSIIQFLAKKEHSRFVIIPPANEEFQRRKNIYFDLIRKNYKDFLPNFSLSDIMDSITLERIPSVTEQRKINIIKSTYKV
jgi:hypothetical protein